jgi:hypothetical protein
MRVGPFVATVLLAPLLLPGCVGPGTRPELLDSALPIAVDDPRVASLSRALVATSEDRYSLVGLAQVSLSAPDLRFSRPQRMALEEPASLRVEILGLFDQVAAILATDGDRYQLYQPNTTGIEEGEVSPNLLWHVARVDLEPAEAVGLLLGAPLAAGTQLEAARSVDDGRVLLAFRDPRDGSRRIFEFDAARRLSRVRQRDAGETLQWEVAYDDYRPVGERTFAHRIEIDFPRVDANADFHFKTAELNRKLPANAFRLTAP